MQRRWRVTASGLLARALLRVPVGPIGAQDASVIAVLREVQAPLERGETEAAKAVLVGAVEQHPDAPQLLALLGTARYLNRKFLAAEGPLRRAVELGQQDLPTEYYLASTL